MFTRENFLRLYRNEGFKFAAYITFVCLYFALVCVFYGEYENWTRVDVLFFVIQTITTVGYGYPAPSDDQSRLFTIFFILIGIFVVFAGLNEFIFHNIAKIKLWFGIQPRTAIEDHITAEDLYKNRILTFRVTFGFVLLVIVSAAILQTRENWTWIKAFYFMVETTSTVGYGDVHVQTPDSKLFVIFYIIVSTTLLGILFKAFSDSFQEQDNLESLETKLQKTQILRFFRNHSDFGIVRLHKADITLAMLLHNGVISQKDVDHWSQKIDEVALNDTISGDDFRQLLVQESDEAGRQIAAIQQAKLNFTTWTVIKSLFSFEDCFHFFCRRREAVEDDSRASVIVSVNGQLPAKKKSPRGNEDVESPLRRDSEDNL